MFSTDRLISQIIIRGSLPDGRFTDQELLDLAYDCLLSEIVPMVLDARAEFLVTKSDLALTAGQAAYDVATRALNGVLREVKLIRGTQVVDLEPIEPEDVTSEVLGTPSKHYMQGNSIIVYPTPALTEDILRQSFFVRPSRLVPVSECGRITAVAANILTVTVPTGWTDADTFDLVKGRAHFDLLAMDLTASSVSAGSITLSSVPTSLQVGDYVTLAEESCFPFLPPEGHVALVQCAVTSALESMGDPASASSAQKAGLLKETFANVLKTRVQGAQRLGTRLL